MREIIAVFKQDKIFAKMCKNDEKYVVFSEQAGNSALLVFLYTGMRVGELKSLEYDGTYVTCILEKTRKGYVEVTRKISVSPMMKKVLPLIDFEQARAVSRYTIRVR